MGQSLLVGGIFSNSSSVVPSHMPLLHLKILLGTLYAVEAVGMKSQILEFL